jgi:hypothetical protein
MFRRMMRMYAHGTIQVLKMSLCQRNRLAALDQAAAGDDHAPDTRVNRPSQHPLEILGKRLVRQVRPYIYQIQGHSLSFFNE